MPLKLTKDYQFKDIPKSRIATFDTFSVALKKHHIAALLEFDVTEARTRLRELRKTGTAISFNAWLLSVIAKILNEHPEACAFLHSKSKLLLFDDINISMIIEKKLGDSRVPVPLVIEKANKKPALQISDEIEQAKAQKLNPGDIVLQQKRPKFESLYYLLPGFFRRLFWKYMLSHPKMSYRAMGNVSVTSVGMMGKINGWFIHKAVHPLSFGIGSVIKKPVVVNNEVRVREILNMTILVDHDVVDGAQMVRFLNDLTQYIESGEAIKI